MTDADGRWGIRSADRVPFADVARVLGPMRCHGGPCHCQRFHLLTRDWAAVSDASKEAALQAQSAAGNGVVAYDGDTPVGWCAVGPRRGFTALLQRQLLWKGRPTESPDDGSVWAVTCFAVSKGHRKQGLTRALLAAAVDVARGHGAARIEGYPMLNSGGDTVPWGEMHVGSRATFAANGFKEVSQPSKRRLVMSRLL